MNINLDIVLVIQSIQCVHAGLKLKPLNISSYIVIFTLLRDKNFLNLLRKLSWPKFPMFKCKKSSLCFIAWFSNKYFESLNQEILKNLKSLRQLLIFVGPLISNPSKLRFIFVFCKTFSLCKLDMYLYLAKFLISWKTFSNIPSTKL